MRSARDFYCSLRCALLSKVNISHPSECWVWTSKAKTAFGYGQLRRDGRAYIATRAMWEILFGPIPGGLFVLHRCDNPPCCNPNHLFLGTNADNMADKERKGRGTAPPVRFGEDNNLCKLSKNDIEAIRAAPRVYGMGAELARQYGVARNTIYRIQSGEARANG